MIKIPQVLISHKFNDASSRPEAFLRFAEIMQKWDGEQPTLEAAAEHSGEIHWRFRFNSWDEAKRFDDLFGK